MFDSFDDPGGDLSHDGVGRYVSGDHGPGGHDGVLADRNPRQDSSVGAELGVFANVDRLELDAMARRGIEGWLTEIRVALGPTRTSSAR